MADDVQNLPSLYAPKATFLVPQPFSSFKLVALYSMQVAELPATPIEVDFAAQFNFSITLPICEPWFILPIFYLRISLYTSAVRTPRIKLLLRKFPIFHLDVLFVNCINQHVLWLEVIRAPPLDIWVVISSVLSYDSSHLTVIALAELFIWGLTKRRPTEMADHDLVWQSFPTPVDVLSSLKLVIRVYVFARLSKVLVCQRLVLGVLIYGLWI